MRYIKYTKSILQEAVNNSFSYAGVLRHLELKPAGGTQSHLKRRISEYEIDVSHFTGQAHTKGKKAYTRRTKESILILRKSGNRGKTVLLNRALLESGVEYKCKECDNEGFYNGKKLTLQVDHIDGNWLDDRIHNLRFLCPNCHSQTDTFGSKKLDV